MQNIQKLLLKTKLLSVPIGTASLLEPIYSLKPIDTAVGLQLDGSMIGKWSTLFAMKNLSLSTMNFSSK